MSKTSFWQKRLEWVYKTFKEDTSLMLIVTGSLGYVLSCLAQAGAVITNPKVSAEKKSFLYPQELMDGFVNVVSFLAITLVAKKSIEKLISTGKFLPKSVRNYLNNNKALYKDKVGKMDFYLDDVLKKDAPKNIQDSYKTYKNFVTTVSTVGASIAASNVISPFIRNKTASKVQKTYIDMKNNPSAYLPPTTQYSSDMKV